MRLSQNLEDLRLLPDVTTAVVNDVWFHYKTLLRSECDTHKRRQARMPQKRFFSRVYNMAHVWGSEVPSGGGGGTADDQDGGGGGGGGGADGGAGGSGGAGRPPKSDKQTTYSPRAKLMRQFVASAFSVHDIISLPVRGDENAVAVKFIRC